MTMSWRSFLRWFLGLSAGLVGALYAFVALVDPYNALPIHWPMQRPIMDINQRFMYPQIPRSGRFDAAVIGTSTSRLIDPRAIDGPLGARFANLAMNAATAWEQSRMLDLFLRHVPRPKRLIIGLDTLWCDPRADENRITFRGFPEWMYDDNPWDGYLYLLNPRTLEIAARLVGHRIGLNPERIRSDGYEVFTPPDEQWSLDRARMHIWGGRSVGVIEAVSPPERLTPEEIVGTRTPALDWLDELLARAGIGPDAVLAFMPHHVAVQPRPGSREAAALELCKARVLDIATRRGATLVDFMVDSQLTRDDTRYWDPLHFKLGVARDLEDWLVGAFLGRPPPENLARALHMAR